MNKKERLEDTIDTAITSVQPLMLLIQIDDYVEISLNHANNVMVKADYLVETYDVNKKDELIHKHSPNVKIIDFFTDDTESLLKIAEKYL